MKDGVVGEITLNPGSAADGRHPAFVTTVSLPAEHPALPAGTILVEGTAPGTASLAAATLGEQKPLGVLNEAVEANEGAGNVLIHGSCPAEILVTVASDGASTAASAAFIAALRRENGIYV